MDVVGVSSVDRRRELEPLLESIHPRDDRIHPTREGVGPVVEVEEEEVGDVVDDEEETVVCRFCELEWVVQDGDREVVEDTSGPSSCRLRSGVRVGLGFKPVWGSGGSPDRRGLGWGPRTISVSCRGPHRPGVWVVDHDRSGVWVDTVEGLGFRW